MPLAAPARRSTRNLTSADTATRPQNRAAGRKAREERRTNPVGTPAARVKKPDQEFTVEETILRQLFLMNLCSLAGYRELADLTEDRELRTFAEVVAHQRSAQARELGAHFGWPTYAPFDSEPAAAKMRLVWLRGLWNLEEDEECRFAESLEEAEVMLEDAYLCARHLLADSPLAELFDDHSIAICGVRQRIEDIVDQACGCECQDDCHCDEAA